MPLEKKLTGIPRTRMTRNGRPYASNSSGIICFNILPPSHSCLLYKKRCYIQHQLNSARVYIYIHLVVPTISRRSIILASWSLFLCRTRECLRRFVALIGMHEVGKQFLENRSMRRSRSRCRFFRSPESQWPPLRLLSQILI